MSAAKLWRRLVAWWNPPPPTLRIVGMVSVAALDALAARWEAEAAEEAGDLTPDLLEYSREGLAASILEQCAAQLRDVSRETHYPEDPHR